MPERKKKGERKVKISGTIKPEQEQWINKKIKDYQELSRTGGDDPLWLQFSQAWRKWEADHNDFVSISRKVDKMGNLYWEELEDQNLDVNSVSFNKSKSLLQGIVASKKRLMGSEAIESSARSSKAKIIVIAGMIIGAKGKNNLTSLTNPTKKWRITYAGTHQRFTNMNCFL